MRESLNLLNEEVGLTMECAGIHSKSIHLVLKELIANKSIRDQKNFTIYQLAKAIEMPHSILVKLLHVDPTKRVSNPRIDTLTRIIDFFKADGFDITIDDLLVRAQSVSDIDVSAQALGSFSIEQTIPLYALDSNLKENVGKIEIKLSTPSADAIALISNEEIKPMFKKGSIFIVDTQLKPEDDTLVAVRMDGNDKILIRKFHIEGHQHLLKSFDHTIEPIRLLPTSRYLILGVVIQVNAKT